MYKKYEQLSEEPGFILKVDNCYTLKQNISCSYGIFTRGSVVRVKSADICYGYWVFALEGSGATDYYSVKIDKHAVETLCSLFEFNSRCTYACDELENLFSKKQNAVNHRIPFYQAFVALAGLFIVVWGCILSSFLYMTAGIILGSIYFTLGVTLPLVNDFDESEHLVRKKQSKISDILKSG